MKGVFGACLVLALAGSVAQAGEANNLAAVEVPAGTGVYYRGPATVATANAAPSPREVEVAQSSIRPR